MIRERRMKARLKKAAVRRRVRAARKTMAAVCYGIIEYDDDIYNYDRDTEQWKIMQKRLEDIGMMTRQEFATAYREVTASAGERQYTRDQDMILNCIDCITDLDIRQPNVRAIIAQAYQIGFSAGCYRWMEGQYRKMRKRENEFHW